MENAIIELVQYFMILLFGLFTYFSCHAIFIRPEKGRNRAYHSMAACMYLFHGSGYFILYFTTRTVDYLILFLAEALIFFLISILYRKCYPTLSQVIFQNMRMLLAIGFVVTARLSLETAVRQFLFAAAILLLCLAVPELIQRFQRLGQYGVWYLAGGLLLLSLLLIFGKEVYGAKNWLMLGPISVQPSEAVKLLFVLGCAGLLSNQPSFTKILLVTIAAAGHVLLLVMEKDLGTALLFFVVYLILLFCATGKKRYLITGLFAGCAAALLAYVIFPHVRVRITAFADPFAVIEQQGYQLAQSLFAIGIGGWFGMGLTRGLPESIPVAGSDFIFSAIAEELGGIIAICLLLVALSCYIMFVRLSVRVRQPFYKLTALGLSTMYIFQVFLNVAGVIRLIPSTGITLPLVSSGGSSLAFSIFMFAVIQGIHVLHGEPEVAGMKREQNRVQNSSFSADDVKQAETKQLLLHNRSIFRMTYVFAGMLFLCAGYLAYFEFFQAGQIINNSYNKREAVLAKQVQRGKILSADGKILAQTVGENEEEIRIYPFGRVFSHVVGRTIQGGSGLEASENYRLLTSSLNGLEQLKLQLNGKKVPGDTVITTLNSEIQQTAYEALGDHRGSVVVLEASTGKILAMVSKPDYNPNTVAEDWKDLVSENTGEAPLLNRATQGLYPPGSTFKILTLLEYFREHPLDAETFSYQCKGSERVFGVTVHCASNLVHGAENLTSAFANSCNSAFAKIGSGLNLDRLFGLTEEFLFNHPLPSKLGTAVSSYVLTSASPENEIAQSVIGLGKTQISPLHNAMIVQTIANQGILMKPYLISEIVSEEGTIVKRYQPEDYGRIITQSEAELLTKYLREVVSHGTASKLSGLSVTAAGKTGTAYYETGKPPHAWFVGFAPAEQPELVISVIVESSGGGSSYAVPIAKKILESYYGK